MVGRAGGSLWRGVVFSCSGDCPAETTQRVSFQWGEDVFIVPANALLITSEEDMVACDASKAGQCSDFICRVDSRRAVPCSSV